ncbi:hypothetical protein LOAG_04882 [Loa loa]|uniref:Uncharacterized protein n=1 Tax=Loa loa TaxID=7209 RepID=A0A1S0U2W2_LOALO|nr:hypothetical protein LOAG_04882 [Loa loa]EFO23606.1 hypothetical protein LOAG_04882 [Loa loa]
MLGKKWKKGETGRSGSKGAKIDRIGFGLSDEKGKPGLNGVPGQSGRIGKSRLSGMPKLLKYKVIKIPLDWLDYQVYEGLPV